MILTCPNCATRYVVKDGSIGPKGRKVRCASCAHSWHQEADPSTLVDEGPLEPPPVNEAPASFNPVVDTSGEPATSEAAEPEAPVEADGLEDDNDTSGGDVEHGFEAAPVAPPPIPEPEELPDPPSLPGEGDTADDAGDEDVAAEESKPEPQEEPEPSFDEPAFAVAQESYEEEAPKRRWPMALLVGLLAVAVAAAALVAFGPPELRDRIGLAQSSPEESPFTLMFEQRSIVPLEGTDSQRISVRGRIMNSTDTEQVVPIIHARVTDGEGALVESWTIDPPQPRLGPGESASFNNARVGEFPEDATLTLAVGNSAS